MEQKLGPGWDIMVNVLLSRNKTGERITKEMNMTNLSKVQATIRTLNTISTQVDFEDGTSITAPDGFVFSAAKAGQVVDILDKICKLVGWCGDGDGGGGGGGGGCYTIIGPDGTKITICPPAKSTKA